jgi:hypothetical protein
MQNGTTRHMKSIPLRTLHLESTVELFYNVSDTWFVFTIAFACLDVLVIVAMVVVYLLKKRHRKIHLDFRRRKEYLSKYQSKYKFQRSEQLLSQIEEIPTDSAHNEPQDTDGSG